MKIETIRNQCEMEFPAQKLEKEEKCSVCAKFKISYAMCLFRVNKRVWNRKYFSN